MSDKLISIGGETYQKPELRREGELKDVTAGEFTVVPE